jgi:hypothetical protein
MVQKLDIAENTMHCQTAFHAAMPTLQGDLLAM